VPQSAERKTFQSQFSARNCSGFALTMSCEHSRSRSQNRAPLERKRVGGDFPAEGTRMKRNFIPAMQLL
jgi:hypothetical protein